MPGLLTHLSIAFIGFLLVSFIFYKSKKKFLYGLSFATGHLIPDILDFGIAGIKQKSFNPAEIMTNPLFRPLAIFGHTFSNWLIIAVIVLAIGILLYKFRKISDKTFISIIVLIIIFLAGIFLHLTLDLLIIEKSYWV